jgi:hypothetical protein
VSSVQGSPSHLPSPSLLAPKGHYRRSSFSVDDESDPVIGHVTSNGKFGCLDPNCSDVSFGRHADFRRHYDHVHASKKIEFFCVVDGCPRSKKPVGKSKGRSFGAREDKMKEHVRTVHETHRKRKRDTKNATTEQEEVVKDEAEELEEREGGHSEGDDYEDRQSKKRRILEVSEVPHVWTR